LIRVALQSASDLHAYFSGTAVVNFSSSILMNEVTSVKSSRAINCSEELGMEFDEQTLHSAYARLILERARIRAMARREMALSIPIVATMAFVAIISTFSFGHAALPPSYDQRSPGHAPASHSTMFCMAAPGAADASSELADTQMTAA
jgi:hypothetical protein